MRNRPYLTLAVFVSLCAAAPVAQTTQADPFARIAFLLGTWDGVAEGKPGKGTARRVYTRELNGRFIRAVHRGEYPPQEKNPKGEVHQDTRGRVSHA